MELSSFRPYLIRARYDWCLDNGLTPQVLVLADVPGVEVPRQYVDEEGRIVLNISPSAVQGLELGDERVSFNARFSGVSMFVQFPVQAVAALGGREIGLLPVVPLEEVLLAEQGDSLTTEPTGPSAGAPTGPAAATPEPERPKLRPVAAAPAPPAKTSDSQPVEGGDEGGKSAQTGPALKVVK